MILDTHVGLIQNNVYNFEIKSRISEIGRKISFGSVLMKLCQFLFGDEQLYISDRSSQNNLTLVKSKHSNMTFGYLGTSNTWKHVE